MAALSNRLRNPTGTAASRVSTAPSRVVSSIREAIREFTASSAASSAARKVIKRVSTSASRAASTSASREVSRAASTSASTSASREVSRAASRAPSTAASREVSRAASRAPSTAASTSASRAASKVLSDNLDKTDRIRKRLDIMKPLPPQQSQKDTVGVEKARRAALKKLPPIIYKPLDWKNISSILNIPFGNIPDDIMKDLLLNSFTEGKYKENIKLLKERVDRYKGGIYKEYHTHIDEIRTHLNKYDYYKIVNEEENKDSSIFYDNLKLLLSSYDPFNITDEELAELKQNLFSKKCMALYDDIIIYEFREAILHTTGEEVTKSTLKKKLKKKVITYRALLFISNIINQHYISSSNNLAFHYLHESTNQNSIKNIELIKILANKHNYILINNLKIDINIFESSIDKSSLDSKTDINKREERINERKKILEYLNNNKGYNNPINKEDFITLDIFEEMTLKQLRRVIKISYVLKTKEGEKKSYCHAFDSKVLYKLFLNNYNKNDKKIVAKNPHSQQEFSEEDIIAVFTAFGKRDFRKDKEDYGTVITTRYDVELTIVPFKKGDIQYNEITILYLVDKGIIKYESDSFKIRLVRITIKEMPVVDNLIARICSLYDDNKIISAMIPFTFHPAFVKYNGETIDETNIDDFAAMIDIK
jgi:hypothetical protein